MGREVAGHNKPDGEVDAHGTKESVGLVFDSPPSATLLSAIESAGN
jgi:hypothetical protein